MTLDELRNELAKDFIISLISGRGNTLNEGATVETAFLLSDLYLKRVFPVRPGEK